MRCDWCSGEQITTNYEYYEYVSTHKSFHEQRSHVCMEEVNTDILSARGDEVGKSRRGDRGGTQNPATERRRVTQNPATQRRSYSKSSKREIRVIQNPARAGAYTKRGKGRSSALSAARRSRSTPGGGVLVLRVLCGVGFESTRGNGRW